MPNYRYIGLTPRFYPDERAADGRSLMAMPGGVHDWERTPDDGQWVLAEDAPEVPEAGPEPAPVTPEPEPGPVVAPPAPEPAPAPVAPAEPVPAKPVPAPEPEVVPEPEPAPEPVPVDTPTPQAVLDWFASVGQAPPARA